MEVYHLSKFFPTSLVSLVLSYNDIPMCPTGLLVYEKLQYLDLSHNHLSVLSLDLLSLTGLTTLNLSHNEITSLPVQLGVSMKSLTHLDVSHKIG
jgi:Leucine-rich repeat (LRR) protein